NEHLIVYVNGVQAGVSTRPGKITATENPVEIGRWGGGSFFVGIIDEAAIFNIVLGEEGLQTDYGSGPSKSAGWRSCVSCRDVGVHLE
ncbi:MAG: LamG-like jellyroll fold domain-containing protein, partial [Candidatus Poribacteria bacterium]